MSEEPVTQNSEASPPFARSLSRLKRAHEDLGNESSRLAPSAPMNSLAVITHARLVARDFAGAAAALSTLLHRYRRSGRSAWYFPREAASVGGCIARRTGSAGEFLESIARDERVSRGDRNAKDVGAPLTRSIALVEAALDKVASGLVREARDLIAGEAALPVFEKSCLVHGFLGALSLSLADDFSRDREMLLADASAALNTAARIDPSAYLFAHMAASAEIALDRHSPRAGLDIFRVFARRNRQDPFAQHGLLNALRLLPSPPRQEVVDTARHLVKLDPLSKDGFNVLREASLANWSVDPPVGCGEIAAVAAAVVEHGAGNVKAWQVLVECLSKCTLSERDEFWNGGEHRRNSWWPSHFFRESKVNADFRAPGLASSKAAVAELLDNSIPYVGLVHDSGDND